VGEVSLLRSKGEIEMETDGQKGLLLLLCSPLIWLCVFIVMGIKSSIYIYRTMGHLKKNERHLAERIMFQFIIQD